MPAATENTTATPKGFVPDAVDTAATPKGFVPDAAKPSDAPDPRSATEVMQDQAANVLKGIPQFLTGLPASIRSAASAAKDIVTGKGTAKAQELVKSALSPYTTVLRGAGALALPDSITAPTRQENESAAQGAGANLGGLLAGEIGGKVVGAGAKAIKAAVVDEAAFADASAKAGLYSKVPESVVQGKPLDAWANAIKSGIENKDLYASAKLSRPVFHQAVAELTAPSTDAAGNQMPRLPMTTDPYSLAGRMPSRAFPIPTAAAKSAVRYGGRTLTDPGGVIDRMVDIAHEPFQSAIQQAGQLSTDPPRFPGPSGIAEPTVKQAIVNDLESKATQAEAERNPALAKAIRARLDDVNAIGDTFDGLDTLKKRANKESAASFDATTGKQINDSEKIAEGWKTLGGTIKQHMYPALEQATGQDLGAAGEQESAVLDARDGLLDNYYNKVQPAHAALSEAGYFGNLFKGSMFERQMLKRATLLERTPAGQFNHSIVKANADNPYSTTSEQARLAQSERLASGPLGTSPPPTITGTQQDLLPTGAVNEEPLLAPPPGTSSGPAGIGESIRKVQMRADQEARRAPPPDITGEQTSLPGANAAKPNEPFYPGKSDVRLEVLRGGPHNDPILYTEKTIKAPDGSPVIGPDGKPVEVGDPVMVMRDYTNQQQLFSHYQIPPPPHLKK